MASIAGTDYAASPLVESIIERAEKKDEPDRRRTKKKRRLFIAARPKRKAAAKRKFKFYPQATMKKR